MIPAEVRVQNARPQLYPGPKMARLDKEATRYEPASLPRSSLKEANAPRLAIDLGRLADGFVERDDIGLNLA